MATDRSVGEYFEGKPESREVFDIVAAKFESFGPCDRTIGSQISWGRSRKFAWFCFDDRSGFIHLIFESLIIFKYIVASDSFDTTYTCSCAAL